MGGFWATGEPWSAKSDQFWVDIFKPKWNLSYIDGARLRDSEEDACLFPLYRFSRGCRYFVVFWLGCRYIIPPNKPPKHSKPDLRTRFLGFFVRFWCFWCKISGVPVPEQKAVEARSGQNQKTKILLRGFFSIFCNEQVTCVVCVVEDAAACFEFFVVLPH